MMRDLYEEHALRNQIIYIFALFLMLVMLSTISLLLFLLAGAYWKHGYCCSSCVSDILYCFLLLAN
jgi:hypothetical protein